MQVFVLDRLIEDDGVRGDEYGPFDKETAAEERSRLQRDKVLILMHCRLYLWQFLDDGCDVTWLQIDCIWYQEHPVSRASLHHTHSALR